MTHIVIAQFAIIISKKNHMHVAINFVLNVSNLFAITMGDVLYAPAALKQNNSLSLQKLIYFFTGYIIIHSVSARAQWQLTLKPAAELYYSYPYLFIVTWN